MSEPILPEQCEGCGVWTMQRFVTDDYVELCRECFDEVPVHEPRRGGNVGRVSADLGRRGMNEPTPTNGKPYYCRVCGLGFGEYLACEEPCCKLESERDAKSRQRKH